MISFVGFDVSGEGFYSVSILVLDDPGLEVVDLAQEASLFEDVVSFARHIGMSWFLVMARITGEGSDQVYPGADPFGEVCRGMGPIMREVYRVGGVLCPLL